MTKILGVQTPFCFQIRGNIGNPTTLLTNPASGIYQMRKCREGKIPIKMRFYRPTNPRTIKQQLNRDKVRNAVIAWSLLTKEEKALYDKRARGRHYGGYHLFVSEHLKSH